MVAAPIREELYRAELKGEAVEGGGEAHDGPGRPLLLRVDYRLKKDQ